MAKISTRKKNPKPRKAQLTGRLIATPAPIQRQYRREVRKAVDEMTREIGKAVLAFFREPESREFFAQDENIASRLNRLLERLKNSHLARYTERAYEAIRKMLGSSKKESEKVVSRVFGDAGNGFTIKPPKMSQDMEAVLKASLEENAGLIRNIYDDYINRISGDLMRTITAGKGNLARLTGIVARCRDVALHRAENVAMDQTRKAYQGMARLQLKESGIKKAIWIHTGGTLRPRIKHVQFDGEEFDLDVGAPIGDTELDEYVFPGECPFCRCTFRPVLNWG